MIYPATYDITILQNSTWRGEFRATGERQEIDSIVVVASGATINANFHGLSAGTKVVLTGSGELPPGMTVNTVYYVIASGLTNTAFKVSATSGGTELPVTGSASGIFYFASPLNLAGYGIDSDIKNISNNTQVATFACSVTDASNGAFKVEMTPSVSSGLATGRYVYDVSLTTSGGDRYYWVTGIATVERTYSRN